MRSLIAAAAVFSYVSSVDAVVSPTRTGPESHVADSELAGARWHLSDVPPRASQAEWQRFTRLRGAAWQANWDRLGVPRKIFGAGVAAPGTVASASTAETFVRAFVDDHIELLAPGARPEDFEIVANELDTGMRTVGMFQYRDGVRVVGGQMSFRFKNDRMFVISSEAVPDVPAPDAIAAPLVKPFYAEEATAWLHRSLGSTGRQISVEGPVILPASDPSGLIFHTVMKVTVETRAPRGRWQVFVDAVTAQPLRRQQLLKFADGTVRFNVPTRWPGSDRQDASAPNLDVQVDSVATQTDRDGLIDWPGDMAVQVTASVEGPTVEVRNDSGAEAETTFSLAPSGEFIWDERDDEFIDAQLNAFIAGNRAMQHARVVAREIDWFRNQTLIARVNITDESCNAYSDGETVNFFAEGDGCENTARLTDVVYHEFGHVFHAQVIIPGAGVFDTSLSEGASDYYAASITGDPGTARGFFGDDEPLRHIDPATREAVWPHDVDSDPHITGLIFAGAMWDLRKALVADGQTVEYADWLFFQVLRRAVDIPSTYVEILAADDDDGDLTNGTPNRCLIEGAFGRHGLVSRAARSGVGYPRVDGLTARVPVQRAGTCGDVEAIGARVHWRARGESETAEVALTADDLGFVGDLPLEGGRGVIEYKVEVGFDVGGSMAFPLNRGSSWYELYVGPLEPIYCTGFESDPALDGWEHSLLAGRETEGADDWQWGIPVGMPGSGDPSSAFSGERVIGNDLGGGEFNGMYQSDKTNAMTSAPIPVAAYDEVRLQYWRWLTVEDGRFDRATILSNGGEVWSNVRGEGSLHHIDRQWRFHDVDLTDSVDNGTVQIEFRLQSDEGLEVGGWTIDDLCIMGVAAEVDCIDCEIDPVKKNDDDGCAATGGTSIVMALAGLVLILRRRRRS